MSKTLKVLILVGLLFIAPKAFAYTNLSGATINSGGNLGNYTAIPSCATYGSYGFKIFYGDYETLRAKSTGSICGTSNQNFEALYSASGDGRYYTVFYADSTAYLADDDNHYVLFVRSGGNWSVASSPAPTNPETPTTDFNEVTDYIYDPVLDNNFGTSTVGASFSIPKPDWLSSIGVELRGPMGNVLWVATTTPVEATNYELDTDYYFGVSGSYELKAFFVRDTGERIDNPVSVYITVNVEEWVYDPVTGDLVPEASTTIATSTLTNFKIECPDDLLVGSLCKLAVGLFIPKVSSIQGMQTSFGNLMSKAPFSFFTQSKTILEAFRVGAASSGGTFSLNLYGSSVPIVSAENATGIGLTSDIINFFKMIMTVGLWLMLAWYLYWRIASIFGV
jgi:hypothetical protein